MGPFNSYHSYKPQPLLSLKMNLFQVSVMLSAVVVAMAAPQALNAQGAQVGNPGYGDALRQLTEQQQNYFGRHRSFQFADGVCRVVQEGHRTQIISFGAGETGYYTELDFEEPVNGAP